MKPILLPSLLVSLSGLALAAAPSHDDGPRRPAHPPCRFALNWTQEQILADPRAFAADLLFWEGKFHQDEVAYNAANGMTYDGTQLDWTSGARTKKHPFSAASKEALQIMLYARAVDGSPEAARFLAPDRPSTAPDLAVAVMRTKLQTYRRFNQSYPGFGGFLPWMTTSAVNATPAWDWVNRVPALDNGELLWAVYAFVSAVEATGRPSLRRLGREWQAWFDYARTTAATVFHAGAGRVCAVSTIRDQVLPVSHPRQGYACEGAGLLDDPYEGELFTHFLHLFTALPPADKAALWRAKRAKLLSAEYRMAGLGPITVEQGYWFSSHELWKVLELPYFDVDLVRRLYRNAERARTCNSAVLRVPGLFASVNNSTDPASDSISGYISPAGIPSIASQKDQYHEVVTPYGAWPTILHDSRVGLAWWHRMVTAKKMQNPYGSTESARVDGKLVAALVTWDSKVTTVMALLGGVGDLVRRKMKTDGVYREFVAVTEREYSRVFGALKGEDVELCLPRGAIPAAGLDDFSLCPAS
ncbi:hypothetical protein CDD83_4070 [Cordyceps sp. RAO-2017]|nr:hypothetical protein CDD83_4070 [Cordyceps sp. RAO-2017]